MQIVLVVAEINPSMPTVAIWVQL